MKSPAKPRKPKPTAAPRFYRGKDVPMAVIRRFARQVAERFKPDKIILFGSHAYGKPHADSDVDILVVMPARNEFDQAVKIRWAISRPFSLDLKVRTPKRIEGLLREEDSFLREIMAKGMVLYEKADAGMAEESRSRLDRGARAVGRQFRKTRAVA